MGKKKVKIRDRMSVWKIVSVLFIGMFILIVAGGAVVMHTLRPSFTPLAQEQIDTARAVVAQDLQSRGESIEDYEVYVTDRVVGFINGRHRAGGPGGMSGMCRPGECPPEGMGDLGGAVQVSLRSNSTMYLYMVDTDSEQVVMRSFTEWFNG